MRLYLDPFALPEARSPKAEARYTAHHASAWLTHCSTKSQ